MLMIIEGRRLFLVLLQQKCADSFSNAEPTSQLSVRMASLRCTWQQNLGCKEHSTSWPPRQTEPFAPQRMQVVQPPWTMQSRMAFPCQCIFRLWLEAPPAHAPLSPKTARGSKDEDVCGQAGKRPALEEPMRLLGPKQTGTPKCQACFRLMTGC